MIFPLSTVVRLLACGVLALSLEASAAEPMTALIVGGGPDPSSNGAQIEGHTKFVAGLLPAEARRTLLFTDGKAESKTVAYGDTTALGEGHRALEVLLPDGKFDFPAPLRAPELGMPLDGGATRGAVRRAITAFLPGLGARPAAALLLYFAGHGSTAGQGEKEESTYSLWKDEQMGVRDFAPQIARLPAAVPVVLVMAQCYSGGFGDLLFKEGQYKNGLIPQNLAGFFSARRDRMASGCGWEIGEADYQDFSSHFFAALAGRNQFGKPTPGGDFDGDGKVTLHEAFCYTLIHDESMDTPVCTSQVLLRWAVELTDRQLYARPYAEVLAQASVGQKAVLEALSERLTLQGEERALTVYGRLKFRDPVASYPKIQASYEADERLNALRQKALAELFARWPALRWEEADFAAAAGEAATHLAGQEVVRRELLQVKKAAEQAEAALENEEAYLMRFIDVYASIVRAMELRERGKEAAKGQYQRVWMAEQQTLPIQGKSDMP